MRVVSNTSPLSNLAIIGHLGLVREQLGIVLIPPTVRAEARFFCQSSSGEGVDHLRW